jgi:K+-transporting ATPase ATPase C chain
MITHLRPALVMTVLFTLLTGIAYPLAITGIGQAAFSTQANGSLIRNGDTIVGSSLIGQNFAGGRFFWPRPSVTADTAYNAAASTGSNLGATSAALKERVAAEVTRLRAAGVAGTIPGDAGTASGSGLDPDISPEYAKAQVARVAKARGMAEPDVAVLVASETSGRLLGIIGEPRVNVLEINLALDRLKVGQ